MKMRTFIIKRLLLLIPVLIGVSIIVFSLTRLAGDPASPYITEKMNEKQIAQVYARLHLVPNPTFADYVQQYFDWLSLVLQGDFGYTAPGTPGGRQPVSTAITTFFPATFELALVSMIIAVFVGIKLGTVSAVKKDKPADHASRLLSLAGVSLPVFMMAIILIVVFYQWLDWFPLGGRVSDYYVVNHITTGNGFLILQSIASGNVGFFSDVLWHLALPALTLSIASLAIITRVMRSSMLETMSQDYVKTARSKGLSEKEVINHHARRNALIPTTTVVGLAFGGLLGGAVVTETIFKFPGLGWWSAGAIMRLDTYSILAFVLLTAVIYVLVNIVVDIMYAYLDPRVRLE
jgi:peptide/nickel transport system permease protein